MNNKKQEREEVKGRKLKNVSLDRRGKRRKNAIGERIIGEKNKKQKELRKQKKNIKADNINRNRNPIERMMQNLKEHEGVDNDKK